MKERQSTDNMSPEDNNGCKQSVAGLGMENAFGIGRGDVSREMEDMASTVERL